MKTINLELLRANKERRDAEALQKIEKRKAKKYHDIKEAGRYLRGYHLFALQEAHYSPSRMTGERKVILGEEAKEINDRLRAEFHAHMCDCLDKKIPRTIPMRHWLPIKRFVEPPNLESQQP